jgi:hypothetical protein
MKKVAALVVLAFVAVAARAQSELDGTWLAEWNVGGKGRLVSAVIKLKNGVGTFRDRVLTAERENNCLKTTAPVTVHPALVPNTFVLVIDRDAALAGCGGRSVMMITVLPDGSVQARWRSAHPVKLTRD